MTDSYSSIIDQVKGDTRFRNQNTVDRGLEGDPEKAARANDLANTVGGDPSAIYGDLDHTEERTKSLLANDIISRNPQLQRYINSHPLAPTVSNDDWGNLSQFSQVMNRWSPVSVFQRMNKAQMQELQDVVDITKEAFKGIARIPDDLTVTRPAEHIAKLGEETRTNLLNMGASPKVAQRTAEAVMRRAQRTEGITAVGMAGMAWLAPIASAAVLATAGAFRAEVARPLQEKLGIPIEGSETVGWTIAALFGIKGMFKGTPKEAAKILDAVEPYIKAGEEPPPDLHPVLQRLVAEHAKQGMDLFDEAMQAAELSSTRERAPDLFRNLARFHNDSDMYIDSDAVRRMYKDKVPTKGDNLLGFDDSVADQLAMSEYSGGYIKVKVHDFIAYVDKNLYKEFRDFIKLSPDTYTLDEIKRLPEAAREEEYQSIHDYIRQAAGIKLRPAQQLELEGVTRPEDTVAFEAGAVGLTKPQYERWMRHIERIKAGDKAENLKQAEQEARRQISKLWKESAGRIRPNVIEDISKLPSFQVSDYFRKGTVRGVRTDTYPKLDRDKVPKEFLPDIPSRFLARKGLLKQEGIDPDTIAGEFGYKSGYELIEDMARHERDKGRLSPQDYFEKTVSEEVQRRVKNRHGKSAERILQEAKEHVVDDGMLGYLSEQTLAMAIKAGQKPKFTKDQVKGWARNRFNGLPFSRKAMDEWMKTSAKAGRNALDAELKGSWAEAFRFYDEQKHAFAVAMEAKKFNRQHLEKFDNFVDRHKARSLESTPQSHMDQIHRLMVNGGIPVKRSIQDLDAELAKRPSLREFYEERIDKDLPPEHDKYDVEYTPSMPVWDELLEPGWKKNVRDMTIAEFKAYNNSLHSIAKSGRMENKVRVEGELLDKAVLRNELVGELKSLGEKKLPLDKKGEPKPIAYKRAYVGLLQLEQIFDRIDRGNPDGPFTKNLMTPLIEAGNNYSALIKEFSRRFRDLEKKYGTNLSEQIDNKLFYEPTQMLKDEEGNRIIPPGGQNFIRMSRNQLRGVLLNMGNESNFDKMARGHGVTKEQIENWAWDNADKKDWQFAEAVGRIFDDLQKLSDQVTTEMSDSVIEKIPVRDVVTPFGVQKGWYYPMIYDRFRIGSPAQDKLDRFHNVRAMTSRGFEKERTGYSAPLNLSISAAADHISRRLRDIAFRQVLHETGKIFYDEGFRTAMTRYYGPHYTDLLTPYLKDIAGMSGYTSANWNAIDRVGENIRSNIVGMLIGWNPSTVMKHGPTALLHSIQEVGVEWYLKAMNDIHKTDPTTSKANIDFMMKGGKIGTLDWKGSQELQRREQHWAETMGGAEDIVMGRPTLRQKFLHGGSKWVAWSDMVSSRIMWLAKYTEQMNKLAPIMPIEEAHTRANQLAERAIRFAHGSTAITSRPELMRRQDFMMRSMTSLYGFFNNTFNRFYRMAWKIKDMPKSDHLLKDVDESLGQFMTYVVLPAFIEEVVTPMTNEKHLTLHELLWQGFLHLTSGAIPLVREIVQAVRTNKDPSMGIFPAGSQSVLNLARDVRKGHFDKYTFGNTLEHLTTLAAVSKGYGSKQLGRWEKAIWNNIMNVEHPRTPEQFYNTFRYGTIKEPGKR